MCEKTSLEVLITKYFPEWNRDLRQIQIVTYCDIALREIYYRSNSTLKRIRKNKDYVYGIWVYKVLGIWKGYYWF